MWFTFILGLVGGLLLPVTTRARRSQYFPVRLGLAIGVLVVGAVIEYGPR